MTTMTKKLREYCMEVAIRSEVYTTVKASSGQEIRVPDYEYVFLTMSKEEILFVETFWKPMTKRSFH